jgi:hypothetical protein
MLELFVVFYVKRVSWQRKFLHEPTAITTTKYGYLLLDIFGNKTNNANIGIIHGIIFKN